MNQVILTFKTAASKIERSQTKTAKELEREVGLMLQDAKQLSRELMKGQDEEWRKGDEKWKGKRDERSRLRVELTDALYKVKDALREASADMGPDLKALEESRERLKAEVEEAEARREKEDAKLKQLLIVTAEALAEKRRRQLEILDQHLKAYKEAADKEVARIKNETRQLKSLSKLLPVPKPDLKKPDQ